MDKARDGRNRKQRLLAGVQVLLTAVGVTCLAACGLNLLDAWWLDRRVEIRPPDEARPTAPAAAAVEPGAVVGRIRIQKLDVDAVVLEGAGASILRHAVGRIASTSQPWEPGTVGLAAHRDSFFRHLRDLAEGDLVGLVTERGTWTYSVTGSEVVDPEDVEVLADTDRPRLVLVTCYPFTYVGSAPRRFVVFADRVSP